MREWFPFIESMLAIGFVLVYVSYQVFAEDCEHRRKYGRVRKWTRQGQKDYK